MRGFLLFGVLLTALPILADGTNLVLRTAADLNDFYDRRYATDVPFDITGDITHELEKGNECIFCDNTGFALLNSIDPSLPNFPSKGGTYHITGLARHLPEHILVTTVRISERLGDAKPMPPVRVGLRDINIAKHRFADIETEATVVDIVQDDVDTRYAFLLLKDGPVYLPASIDSKDIDKCLSLIGSRIRLVGTFFPFIYGVRRFSNPFICTLRFEVVQPPPHDPFAVPDLDVGWYQQPEKLASLDQRRLVGTVLASWDGNRLMIQHGERNFINVSLRRGQPLPPCNQEIELVGYPRTDSFRINLAYALWRPAARDVQPTFTNDTAKAVAATDIALGKSGQNIFNCDFYGRLVRIAGTVRSVAAAESPERRLYLDSDGVKVPVDFSSTPDAAAGVEIGAEVEVTGRCLIETSEWSSHDVFPRATGFAVIVRSADDIRVLKRPPWWTPARFAMALVALLGVVGAILLWNLTLQTLVVRRARQLYKSEIARNSSELRVGERTRLAVELHDTLVQNLTGVSMELEAGNVAVAARALNSCRAELRNCLWDLRSQALEEPDLTRAIRRTLQPLMKSAAIAVRFDVARTRVLDNTAHTVLRVVRELVGNAIRHGRATKVKVAGALDTDALRCAVTDNGTGFDPETAPGVLQGHFGLQGIRERLQLLDGTLTIESSPGRGTRAVFTLPRPKS